MICRYPLPLLDKKCNQTATEVEEKNHRSKIIQQVRSFTSFQMIHTHASLPRGFFNDVEKALEALI
jgi:hypothetical protein